MNISFKNSLQESSLETPSGLTPGALYFAPDSGRIHLAEAATLARQIGGAFWDIDEEGSRLPDGYTECEYLESTGTQYIDTGAKVSIGGTYKAVIKDQLSSASGYAYQGVNYTFQIQSKADADAHSYTYLYEVPSTSSFTITSTCDGASFAIANRSWTSFTNNTALSAYLFAFRSSSTGRSFWTGKVYYFRFYSGEELVCDLVPALRDSDKVPGMYDLVSGTFLTNGGTGQFEYKVIEKGNNILLPPNNEIWYTTNTGDTVELSEYWGGEQPIYNIYENGKGIMVFTNNVTDLTHAFDFDERTEDETQLTSVTIPKSVTSISSQAFYYCSSLISITIPDSVTSIGGEAFEGCESLTSITFPDSVTSIGESAFLKCSGLTIIKISNSVTSISDYAFERCSSLARVIYKGTTYISKSSLITALTSNGVIIGSDVFRDTALSA